MVCKVHNSPCVASPERQTKLASSARYCSRACQVLPARALRSCEPVFNAPLARVGPLHDGYEYPRRRSARIVRYSTGQTRREGRQFEACLNHGPARQWRLRWNAGSDYRSKNVTDVRSGNDSVEKLDGERVLIVITAWALRHWTADWST